MYGANMKMVMGILLCFDVLTLHLLWSWELYHNDQANIWQAQPSMDVCQIVRSWKLGSWYNAQLLVDLSYTPVTETHLYTEMETELQYREYILEKAPTAV